MKFICGQCSSVLNCGGDHGTEMACPFCASSLRIPTEPGATAEVLGRPVWNAGMQTIGPDAGHHNLTVSIQADGLGFPPPPPGVFEYIGDTKYERGEEVASGGMGSILSVRDLNLKRRVAMKVMRYPDMISEDQLARFIEEAQITGQLEHPGIVPVHELGVDAQNRPYYTMKLLRGQTLFAVFEGLRRGDPETVERWPLHRLISIFLKICEAIRYAHSKRVLHRDLKPANIMIGEFGEVQVLDWGLSKVLTNDRGDRADDPAKSTEPIESARTGGGGRIQSLDGNISGTLQYMAPEQAAGKIHELDERTDIYGLGAILYEMLSLRPPVTGNDFQELMKNTEEGKVAALSRLPSSSLLHCRGGRIPRPLAAIAMKALSRSPEARYDNCAELISDIEQYQQGFATRAEQASPWRRTILLLRRRKVFHVAGFLLLGAILSGSIVGWMERGDALRSEEAARTALAQLEQANAAALEARQSAAPALLAAAMVYENQGRFDEARTMADQALDADPNLVDAHRLLAFLHAAEGQPEEAHLHLAHVEPSGPVDDLRELLRSTPQPGESEYAEALAQAAARADFVGLSCAFFSQAFVSLEGQHLEQLPVWKRRLDKDWPGAAKNLRLLPEGGLLFRPSPNVRRHIKDLEPLRGIPLNSVHLSEMPQITSLEPLRDMPLHRVHLQRVGIADLSPLAGMPLTRLHLGVGTAFDDFSALRNKRFDVLHIAHSKADLRPLASVHCRELHLTGSVASLSFLDDIKGLEVLHFSARSIDGNYRPVLRLHTLKQFTGESYLGRGLHPVFTAIMDQTKPGQDAALLQIRSLRGEIRDPAQFQFSRSLDIFESLLLRRQGRSISGGEPLALPLGGRRIAAIPCLGTLPNFDRLCTALDADLARVDSAEEQVLLDAFVKKSGLSMAMIGLRSEADGWVWMDGSEVTYTNIHSGAKAVAAGQSVCLAEGGWVLSGGTAIDSFLLQWQAE